MNEAHPATMGTTGATTREATRAATYPITCHSHAGRHIAAALALIILGALIATRLWVGWYAIPSESMEPTLDVGDTAITIATGANSLEHGDVIVFHDPGGWLNTQETAGDDRSGEDDLIVKRIIGLPGDDISWDAPSATLSINGTAIREPYAESTPDIDSYQIHVTAGNLFVLGDNRAVSADSSRHLDLNNGMVPINAVKGTVIRRIHHGQILRLPAGTASRADTSLARE